MTIFVITVAVFILAMLGMGVGVLMGRSAPRGSCGGIATADCDGSNRASCSYCGRGGDDQEVPS